jgi:hypothetical protein
MKVQVFVRHELDPELVDYLEKLDTYSQLEICGDYAVLNVVDPETILADVRKITREAERINSIYEQLGWPWMAREVLDRKAVIENGALRYLRTKSRMRKEVENRLGSIVSDSEFDDIMEAATRDIVVNRLAQGKPTTVGEVIKIAARCATALRRCGR